MPLKIKPPVKLKAPTMDNIKRPIEGLLKVAFGVQAINIIANLGKL